jgi:hypothetical protein
MIRLLRTVSLKIQMRSQISKNITPKPSLSQKQLKMTKPQINCILQELNLTQLEK